MARSQVHLHVLLLLTVSVCESSVEINGAGASFPFDVYSAWLPAYKAHRSRWIDLSMKYLSVGSGAGLASIKGETGPAVAYAGSESVLNDTDYMEYPDLQMFPAIGGAIVMAFNLPGMTNLNLKMSDIVGIYNGSIQHWNHSSLVDSNPGTKMPAQPIHVTARRDKSGSTELFTSSLSASDHNWKKTFGTFSEGLRDDDSPYVWDPQVVTLFGETNRGVSGLILSTKYSIGYLGHSDAVTGKLPYARVQNKAGNFVDATPVNVRSAMDDFAGTFTDRMTTSLVNPPGAFSYPIAAYSYLIVRKTTMTDCVVARELVRYIEWFYTDTIPRTECENLHMVPVTTTVSSLVIDKVLKTMTCQDHNVYSLVLADLQYEEIASQEWRLPVFITVPIFSLLFICLLLYMVRDQIRLNRALLRNEWKINSDDIVFDGEQDNENSQSFGSKAAMNGSRNKVYPSIISLDSDNSHLQAMSMRAGFRTGRWRGRRVLLVEQYVLSRAVNLRMRRAILWMRDQVRHANISEFCGLLLQDGLYSTVSNYCSKGDLQNLLHGTRYNIDNNFKFSLCLGIAKGMAYLHSQKLIHGSLTSSKIFIDDLWSVRVSSWEAHTLAGYQGKSLPPPDMGIDEWAKEEFWTAPELLKGRTPPTTHSDVYSFAIVMQEIFSRDIPYAEQSNFQSPSDTLEQIVTISLRPVFTADTPLGARDIMQRAWDMDPLGRPSFQSMVGSIRKACPKIRSVMDSMMDSLTQYVGELEENIQVIHRSLEDKAKANNNSPVDESQASTDKTEVISRFRSLPPEVARMLGHKQLQTQLYECVTVLVSCLHGMDKLLRVSTPQDITDMLTDLYQALDGLLSERSDVLKVHVLNDSYTLVTGLPQRTCDHLKTMATLALSMLSMARTFTIRHRREDRLRMRIGLSTGSVIAGLVDSKPSRLVVLGEALTRAQSMAATSLPMTIQMPEATFTQISALRTFTCVERKVPAPDQDKKQPSPQSYWLIGSKTMTETFYPESL